MADTSKAEAFDNWLRSFFDELCQNSRLIILEEQIRTLEEISVFLFSNDCQLQDLSYLTVTANFFRCLRNASASSPKNKEKILRSFVLRNNSLKPVKNLFELLYKDKANLALLIALQVCLQYIGNFVSGNEEAVKFVWKFMFRENNLFSDLLLYDDKKVQMHTCMIFYNCLNEENLSYLMPSFNAAHFMDLLTSIFRKYDSEFSLFAIEKILLSKDLTKNYCNCQFETRCLLLDSLIEQLNNSKLENSSTLESYNNFIDFIKNHFKKFSMDIVKIASPSQDQNEETTFEIMKMLSILCKASISNELKKDAELISVTVDLLKAVHLLGKSGSNCFTALSSLKALDKEGQTNVENHPAFSFKNNLIQLIGNLSYKCPENQNLVRSCDGIPLLLDCCNMDARNPFIIQWVVLAMRNLLEDNIENQNVVAAMNKVGMLEDNPALEELGIVAKSEK